MTHTNQYYTTPRGRMKVAGIYCLGNEIATVEVVFESDPSEIVIMTAQEFAQIKKSEILTK